MPIKPELNTIKEALANTYFDKCKVDDERICEMGKTDLLRAKSIGELIDVYKYYQTLLIGRLFIPITFFRTYGGAYRQELQDRGIYLDRQSCPLSNPKQKDIILLGNTELKLVKNDTAFTRIIACHDSKINVLLMGCAIAEINIADKSNVKVGYINEQARLTIISHKEIITYPQHADANT